MTEKRTIIDKGVLVPVGVIMAIVIPIMWVATLRAEVDSQRKDIDRLGMDVKDAPTRVEFDTIKEDIGEIKMDVKTLLSK